MEQQLIQSTGSLSRQLVSGSPMKSTTQYLHTRNIGIIAEAMETICYVGRHSEKIRTQIARLPYDIQKEYSDTYFRYAKGAIEL